MPARLLSPSRSRRGVLGAAAGLTLALLCSPVFASHRHAAHSRQAAALTPFARAEQLRDALESRPESSRTHGDYERVLDAYRAVYHGNPADPKAAESVNMVAGLLAEEGRIFHQDTTLLGAVGQFDFLLAQYPVSPYGASALLAKGAIYLHDLHDPIAAKRAYLKFLSSYPRNPLAAQARAGLKEIQHQRRQKRPLETPREIATESNPEGPPSSSNAAASRTTTNAPIQNSSPAAHTNELTSVAPETVVKTKMPVTNTGGDAAEGQPLLTGAMRVAAQQHHGQLPLVTNVRHWSTPVYTRVAIDLQDQVEYEAARVPNPDRIYFDLHGTRVAPELIGKMVNVTDNGFLERIRVAQFSNDVTRVVLDVNQVTEYSAFFLPNPWRLIIDIHGARPRSQPQPIASAPSALRAPQPNARQPEPVASSSSSAGSRQATRALRDIAEVSTRPDQVKATSKPTTRPIVANVNAPNVNEPSYNGTPQTNRRALSSPPVSSAVPGARRGAHPRTPDDDETADDDEDDVTIPKGTSHEAASTLNGQRSLTRALGLKIGRIVVDAGHGGHDSGTLGPDGIQEKDVVLDVARRLGKLLRQRMGSDVIYTRDNDTFIPLEQRTAIANKAQADLFISVHANSSSDPTARGVETYYLNFTTSPDALEVAARENAVSDESIHELSGLVKKITLKDKIDESREFAADVETSLYSGLEQGNPGLRDRGVKKAPFVVLIGANMPSILAEISFLTNPDDATQLREPEYRQRIAESLYRGVAKYVNGLSGLRVAQNGSRTAGN
jgi:N-acetylmuramoyl-L-alanine amidase